MRNRIKCKPSGLSFIRMKLSSLGVADDILNSVISDAEKGYDEFAAAYELAKKRAGRLNKAGTVKAKRRIYGYLLRRRFKKGVIFRVLNKIFGNQTNL